MPCYEFRQMGRRCPRAWASSRVSLAGLLAGLPFSRVNPRRVRDFARASGVLAKTDALDARILAEFGQKMRPSVTVLPDEQTRHRWSERSPIG